MNETIFEKKVEKINEMQNCLIGTKKQHISFGNYSNHFISMDFKCNYETYLCKV